LRQIVARHGSIRLGGRPAVRACQPSGSLSWSGPGCRPGRGRQGPGPGCGL